LPRNSAWPPALLGVYLETRAAALGLDDSAQISVRCGQPESSGSANGAASGRAHESSGSGFLEGFTLRIEAGDSPVCSWHAADPAQAGPAADPRLAGLRAELARRFGEPRATLNARLRAIAACLPAPSPLASHIVVDAVGHEDWLLLRAGGAVIACTVAEIRGVSLPVAIAMATGGFSHDARRLAEPGQRAAALDQWRGAPADGVPADGVLADGVLADGVLADGVLADGVLADGVPADGVPADSVPADSVRTR